MQICSDASVKLSAQQRVSPSKADVIKAGSKETPLMNRSMKRTTGTINEVCPQCGRSFGSRAYDRHVEWCREKAKIAYPTLSAQQHIARERMQARTKYKAPNVRCVFYSSIKMKIYMCIIYMYVCVIYSHSDLNAIKTAKNMPA